MDSTIIKQITADWPGNLSYDKSDDKIKAFYSESEGATTKRGSIFFGKRLLDIFIFAMALGKQSGVRTPLKSKSQTMPVTSLRQDEVWLMTCVALVEPKSDLDIFAKPKDIVTICEEYANTGIKRLIAIDARASPSDPLGPYEELLEKHLQKLKQ